MEIKNGLKLGDEVILQSKGGRRRKWPIPSYA
jgi:hypothetical protein